MIRLIILRFLETYFRHRWLYLAPILLMLAVAAVFLSTSKPKFIASGIMMVQRQSLLSQLTSVSGSEFTWQTPAAVTVGELRELIQTDSFLRAVIQHTDLEDNMDDGQQVIDETINTVRQAVWASSQGDNQVYVAATHGQPQIAYQLANATIETFVKWKINAEITDSEAAHKFFTDLSIRYRDEADQVRQKLYNYLNSHPMPIKGDRPAIEQIEIAQLQADLDSAESRYISALAKDEDAQLAAAQAEENARQSYIVIDAPRLPDKSSLSRKDIALQVSVFILVGVIISGMSIVGGALLDRTFRFPIDVWHAIDLKVLTMVPDVTSAPLKKKRMWRKKEKGEHLEQGAAEAPDLAPIPVGVLEPAEDVSYELEGVNLPVLANIPEISMVFEAEKNPRQSRKRGNRAYSGIEPVGKGTESFPSGGSAPIDEFADDGVTNIFETAAKDGEKVKVERK
jgi:capsular polysaccharide biosynthesis protein